MPAAKYWVGGRRPCRADEAKRAADADVVDVVADQPCVRPRLAVAAERAVDDALVPRLHGIVIHAEPLDDAGSEALQHHIRLLGHAQERLLSARLLEVERDGPLVAAERPERLRALAHPHLHAPSRAGRLPDR